MKPNKLYYFLLNHKAFISEKSTLNQDHIASKPQRGLIMYHLDTPTRTVLTNQEKQEYTLLSHHMSFYESIDPNNANLSEAHYTAYFLDQEGNQHEAHVYFDEKEQVAKTPTFAKEIAKNSATYTKLKIDKDFSDNLAQLALNHCLLPLSQLKRCMEDKTTELCTQFESLEEKLTESSKELETNRDMYLTMLTRAIEILSEITQYSDNSAYKDILTFMQSISLPSKEKSALTNTISDLVTTPAAPEDKESTSQLSTKESLKLLKEKLKEHINLAISDGFAGLAAIRSVINDHPTNFTIQITAFSQYEKMSQKFMSDIEINPLTGDFFNLSRIGLFKAAIYKLGRSILLSMLKTATPENKFLHLAKQLKAYLNPFPADLYRSALKSGNAPLLDFILTNTKNFPINTFMIEGNLNSVAYCFQHNNSISPLVDCFDILIHHNASVMIPAPTTGLPVAHELLAHKQNTLNLALEKNSKKTIQCPQFMKQLIRSLQNFIASNTLEAAQQSLLSAYLIDYKELLSQTKKLSLINDATLETKAGDIVRNQNQDYLQRALQHPDYIAASLRFHKTETTYLNGLSKLAKMQMKRSAHSGADKIGALKSIDSNKANTFEQTLSASIETFEIFTHNFELRIELQNIIKQLKKEKTNKKLILSLHERKNEIATALTQFSADFDKGVADKIENAKSSPSPK